MIFGWFRLNFPVVEVLVGFPLFSLVFWLFHHYVEKLPPLSRAQAFKEAYVSKKVLARDMALCQCASVRKASASSKSLMSMDMPSMAWSIAPSWATSTSSRLFWCHCSLFARASSIIPAHIVHDGTHQVPQHTFAKDYVEAVTPNKFGG